MRPCTVFQKCAVAFGSAVALSALSLMIALPVHAQSPFSPPVPPAVKRQISNQIIVRYRKTALAANIAGLHRSLNVRSVREIRALKAHLLTIPKGKTADDILASLRKDPNVLYAERNAVGGLLETRPNDLFFPNLWGMENTGQEWFPGNRGTRGAHIAATKAWDLFTGSRNTVVAVLDTGIDYTHPDLVDNLWTNPGEIAGNGVDDDGNGVVDDVHGFRSTYYFDDVGNITFVQDGDPNDDNGHGTHCAGTVGASGNNGIGVAGVNWNVTIVAAKWINDTGNGDAFDAPPVSPTSPTSNGHTTPVAAFAVPISRLSIIAGSRTSPRFRWFMMP